MAAGQIRDTLQGCWDVLTRKRALGATAEFLRVFLICTACHRVVPYYRLTGLAGRRRRGCACGNTMVRPGAPAYLTGAAWVLWSLAWRKWIRRCGEAWDPRVPIRVAELPR